MGMGISEGGLHRAPGMAMYLGPPRQEADRGSVAGPVLPGEPLYLIQGLRT